MRLYKAMSEKSTVKYLHSGTVNVDAEDNIHGLIRFSEELPVHAISLQNVVLEFDVPSVSGFYQYSTPLDNGWELKLVRSRPTASRNQEWMHLLDDNFKLISITLPPKCKIDQKVIRSRLAEIGKDDVVIKGD